jgi:hypothetical protein
MGQIRAECLKRNPGETESCFRLALVRLGPADLAPAARGPSAAGFLHPALPPSGRGTQKARRHVSRGSATCGIVVADPDLLSFIFTGTAAQL